MKKLMIPITYENVQPIVRVCEPYMKYFDIDLKYGRHSVDATSYLGVLSFCGHTVEVIPLVAALKDDVDDDKVRELFDKLKLLGGYEEE